MVGLYYRKYAGITALVAISSGKIRIISYFIIAEEREMSMLIVQGRRVFRGKGITSTVLWKIIPMGAKPSTVSGVSNSLPKRTANQGTI
jgi:hypothetical protein